MGSLFDATTGGLLRRGLRRLTARSARTTPGSSAGSSTFTPAELQRREVIRDRIFRTQGITFTLADDEEGLERTFPMDLLPRIIPADEWDVIERGIVQRVTALNRFLEDLYVGEQAAIRDRVVPRWLVHTAEGFRREAFGIPSRMPRAASSRVSTSCGTPTAPTGCSRTTSATPRASPTCSRTARR
jgi:hypothetical protein